MFRKIITTALVSTVLATGFATTASAMGGDGPPPFITMHNPDGSSVTVRGHRDGSRTVKTRRPGKKVKVRRVPRRGTSWAHNHTTGVTSIGVAPGVHVIVGPFGVSFGF